jgi:5-methylcytosine-specific restriction endonuclease McrA
MVVARRIKRSASKILRDRLWEIFSQYIKLRDKLLNNGLCRICGKKPIQCAYHIIPVSHGHDAIRYDPENVVGACNGCNNGERLHRLKYREKHIAIFGAELYEKIQAKARLTIQLREPDFRRLIEEFKSKIETLCKKDPEQARRKPAPQPVREESEPKKEESCDEQKTNCAFVKMVDIGEVKPNPRNPNQHSPEQIILLAKLIKEHGWRSPITVSNLSGYVVRGHGRLLAAQHLGLKQVPVDYQDYESNEMELADLLADNKISELADLDYQKVSEILMDIPETIRELSAFRDFEIGPLLNANWQPPQANDSEESFDTGNAVTFKVTGEQAEVINKAIAKLKLEVGTQAPNTSDGRALELICSDFLATPDPQ